MSAAEDLHAFDTPEWSQRLLTPQGVTEAELRRFEPHCRGRLDALEEALNAHFVGKGQIVKWILVTAIAHQPLLIVGEPGTAKSALVLSFCQGLGLARERRHPEEPTWFQYLLHGFTEPDEVLGPVDLAALRAANAEFRRLRTGSITDASVIFLDEVFRGNSAILNALLSVMNERRVYEAGKMHRARARLFFGASNDVPRGRQMDELRAFYERFTLRLVSECVPTGYTPVDDHPWTPPEDRVRLLEVGWRQEAAHIRSGSDAGVFPQVACLNDVLTLHRLLGLEFAPNERRDEKALARFHRLVDLVHHDPRGLARVDDRKFVRLYSLMCAHGLRQGQRSLSEEAIRETLCHVWDRPEQRHALAELVRERAA